MMYHYLGGVRGVGQLDGDLEDVGAALSVSVLVGALVSMVVVVAVAIVIIIAVAIAIAVAIGGGRCDDLCSTQAVSHGLGIQTCVLFRGCRVEGSGLNSHSPDVDLFEASLLLLAAMMAVGGVCDYNEGMAQRGRDGAAVARREDIQKGSINVQWRRYLCGSQLGCRSAMVRIFSQIPSRRLAASLASGKPRQPGSLRDDRNSEHRHVCWDTSEPRARVRMRVRGG
jgi:hypothetical protein